MRPIIGFGSGILCILLNISVFSFATPEPQQSLFVEGNSQYQQRNFAAAEHSYRQLLDRGIESGSLYYNLGNACFKQTKLGEAIYFWEKARRIMPGDPDVKANLEFARLMMIDRIEIPEDPFPVRLLKNAVHYLTISQESRLILILFLLANILFSIHQFTKQARLAFWTFIASITLGLLVLLLGCSLAWKAYEKDRQTEGVIIEQKVDIRSGPSTDYMVVVTVHEGILVRIRGETDEWYQVLLPNGWNGWLPKNSLLVL